MRRSKRTDFAPTDASKRDSFQRAVFVFDTSALLDFYFYSRPAQDEIFEKVLSRLEDRLWIPSHVEFEFLKNREKVRRKPIASYKKLLTKDRTKEDAGHIEEIGECVRSIKTENLERISGHLQTFVEKTKKPDKHPFLDSKVAQEMRDSIDLFSEHLGQLEAAFEKFQRDISRLIDEKISDLEQVASNDQVAEGIRRHFNVGPETPYRQVIQYVAEGDMRFAKKIPPGYEDDGEKIGLQRFADLIIWKETVSFAKNQDQPIILIVNDVKEDWWEFERGKRTSKPRYELVKEMADEANSAFWMFDMKDFLLGTDEFLGATVRGEVIEEVKSTILPEMDIETMVASWLTANLECELTQGESDFGYDFVMHRGEYGKTGVVAKHIARRSDKRIENLLFRRLNIHDLARGCDRLLLFLVCDTEAEANQVKANLSSASLDSLKVRDVSVDFVVGYINEARFVPLGR